MIATTLIKCTHFNLVTIELFKFQWLPLILVIMKNYFNDYVTDNYANLICLVLRLADVQTVKQFPF